MEYVDGEDLASLLSRIGRLPRDKALDLARDLCAGRPFFDARTLGDLRTQHTEPKAPRLSAGPRSEPIERFVLWSGLGQARPGPWLFFYRASPRKLVAANRDASVRFDDPPGPSTRIARRPGRESCPARASRCGSRRPRTAGGPSGLPVLLTIVGLSVYGCRTSLAGKPAFGRLLED